jgi:hypothetical protein
MFDRDSVKRLDDKSPLHAIQMELQRGYALSPVEAQVLARWLQQLVDEQTGYTRNLGQIIYQAIISMNLLASLSKAVEKLLSSSRSLTRPTRRCWLEKGLLSFGE